MNYATLTLDQWATMTPDQWAILPLDVTHRGGGGGGGTPRLPQVPSSGPCSIR